MRWPFVWVVLHRPGRVSAVAKHNLFPTDGYMNTEQICSKYGRSVKIRWDQER